MGGRRPWLLALLLVLAILCASFPKGFGRNIKIMRLGRGGAFGKAFAEGKVVKGREAAELGFSAMDYSEPGANTNPRSGSLWGTPPPGPQH